MYNSEFIFSISEDLKLVAKISLNNSEIPWIFGLNPCSARVVDRDVTEGGLEVRRTDAFEKSKRICFVNQVLEWTNSLITNILDSPFKFLNNIENITN